MPITPYNLDFSFSPSVTWEKFCNRLKLEFRALEVTVDEIVAAGGDVVGPSSAVANEVVVFDGTTGKLVKAGVDNVYAYKNAAANAGQVQASHWIKLTSANTLADSTATQPLFDGGGGPAGGALTLGTGQYFFECLLHISAMSATSGNGEFELAGTATYSQVLFHVSGIDDTSPLAAGTHTGSGGATAAANEASMLTAAIGTAMLARINGTFNITVAGTVIPSIDLVTGGVTPAVNTGSYFRCWRAGDTGAASVGAWT